MDGPELSRLREVLVRNQRIELRLDFAADDSVVGSRPDSESWGIWSWMVSISVRDFGGGEDLPDINVGLARVVMIDLDVGVDIFDSADVLGGDVFACLEALLERGVLRGVLADEFAFADRILLLDHVLLEADARGHGIGPDAARAIVRRLAGANTLVAAHPQPTDGRKCPQPRFAELPRSCRRHGAVSAFAGLPTAITGLALRSMSDGRNSRVDRVSVPLDCVEAAARRDRRIYGP